MAVALSPTTTPGRISFIHISLGFWAGAYVVSGIFQSFDDVGIQGVKSAIKIGWSRSQTSFIQFQCSIEFASKAHQSKIPFRFHRMNDRINTFEKSIQVIFCPSQKSGTIFRLDRVQIVQGYFGVTAFTHQPDNSFIFARSSIPPVKRGHALNSPRILHLILARWAVYCQNKSRMPWVRIRGGDNYAHGNILMLDCFWIANRFKTVKRKN